MSSDEDHQLDSSSRTRNVLKGVVIAFAVLSFFCVMSRIDFIVHSTLYAHGLRFSYEWAVEYWRVYDVAFVVFAVCISLMYWLGSGKTKRDLRCSGAIFATVIILAVGGLQDILFFGLWTGSLPPSSVVWWWTPWSQIFGTWTSQTQIFLTSLMLCASTFLWITISRKSR